jgi:uncharacterized membrane protein YhaH (DUF805 family)
MSFSEKAMNFLRRNISALKDAFFDAIRNTFNLRGRTSRRGVWLFVLMFVLMFVLITLTAFLIIPKKFVLFVFCFLLLTSPVFFSLFIRRLHDLSRSGWWLCLAVMLLVLRPYSYRERLLFLYLSCTFVVALCTPSKPDNNYGVRPVGVFTTCFPQAPPESIEVRFFKRGFFVVGTVLCTFIFMLNIFIWLDYFLRYIEFLSALF